MRQPREPQSSNNLCRDGDRYYEQGNYAEAVKCYLAVADKNGAMYGKYQHPYDIGLIEYRLGLCFFEGKGVNEDKAEALVWFTQSAGHNYTEAMKWMGYIYDNGEGTPVNAKIANYWYSTYVRYCSVENILWVIRNHVYRNDPDTYFYWCDQLAEREQYDMSWAGYNFYTGSSGFPKDSVIAFYCYNKSAEYSAKAMKIVGDSAVWEAKSSAGVNKAFDLYFEAANYNCADAQFAVYACGSYNISKKLGMPNMDEKWLNLIEESYLWAAARNGCIPAQMELASLCYYGFNSIEYYRNYKWTFIWCRKAIKASGNDPDCFMYALMGECNFLGRGTRKNLTEAKKWFEAAKSNLPSENSDYNDLLSKAIEQRLQQINNIYSSSSEEKYYNGELEFDEIRNLVPFKSYSSVILYTDYSIYSQDVPLSMDDVDINDYEDISEAGNFGYHISQQTGSAPVQSSQPDTAGNSPGKNVGKQVIAPEAKAGGLVFNGKPGSSIPYSQNTDTAVSEINPDNSRSSADSEKIKPAIKNAKHKVADKKPVRPEIEKEPDEVNVLAGVIERIVALRGIEIFNDTRIFLNIFSDLAPDRQKRDRKFLKNILNEGIADDILDTSADQQIKLNRIKNKIRESGMNDEINEKMSLSIAAALKWNVEIKR